MGDYAIALVLGVPVKAVGMIVAPISGKRSIVERPDAGHRFGVRDDVNLEIEIREVLAGVDFPIAMGHAPRHVRRQAEVSGVIRRRQVRVVAGEKCDAGKLIGDVVRLAVFRDALEFRGIVFGDPVLLNPGMARPAGIRAGCELRPLDSRPAQTKAQIVENRELMAREFFNGNGGKLRGKIL